MGLFSGQGRVLRCIAQLSRADPHGLPVAVLGGALGCLLLLLRKPAAFHVLIASLIGEIVSMMHIFGIAGFSSFGVWTGVLVQLAVTFF